MSVQPNTFFSATDYLDRERHAAHKSEYFNGEIFAMAGASIAHNILTLNIGSELLR